VRPSSGWERVAAVIAFLALTLVACSRASDEVREGPPRRIADGAVVPVGTASALPAGPGWLPRIGHRRAVPAEPVLALDPDLVIGDADLFSSRLERHAEAAAARGLPR
jgi:hypothetical protein